MSGSTTLGLTLVRPVLGCLLGQQLVHNGDGCGSWVQIKNRPKRRGLSQKYQNSAELKKQVFPTALHLVSH